MQKVVQFIAWLAEMYAEVRMASGYLELRNGEIVAKPAKNSVCYPVVVIWDVNREFYRKTVEPRLREFGDVSVDFDIADRAFIMFRSYPMSVTDHLPGWEQFSNDIWLSAKYSHAGRDSDDTEWGEIKL